MSWFFRNNRSSGRKSIRPGSEEGTGRKPPARKRSPVYVFFDNDQQARALRDAERLVTVNPDTDVEDVMRRMQEWSQFDDLAAGGGLVAVVTRLWSQVYARLAAPVPPGPCAPGGGHLCLGGAAGDRFRVDAAFLYPYAGDRPGRGKAAPLTADTGAFWYFAPGNLELLVKVLDGRPVNGHAWVLWASATDVAFELEDAATGVVRRYVNAPYHMGGGADTTAFS